ncbi:helix-turn-helix domain-containing protein [Sulfobacillus thermosulfidooxidans]|uniref:helix-turn-helix domain-containing protein n=1 Tax=Sulfobacillus thermosulfidooxidans TaxID=28034 RepID=UPI0006B42965|nr:helix-turn-helix transcriptional regulator [Sulfobacillus thermosulfidooxidans]
MPSPFASLAMYWKKVWQDHRRFLLYSFALTAWISVTVAAFTKISAPSLYTGIPFAITAAFLFLYRHRPLSQIARFLVSRKYLITWNLVLIGGLWQAQHLWWQTLLGILTVPIISQWFDQLLVRADGHMGVLAATWAFGALFGRALSLPEAALWQLTHMMWLPLIAAVVMTALYHPVMLASPPDMASTSRENAGRVYVMPFAVVGVVLIISQAFSEILDHSIWTSQAHVYGLSVLIIMTALFIFPLVSEPINALLLYFSITLIGVAIMLLEAKSAIWLSFPFFRLAREFIIFWWTAELIRLQRTQGKHIPLILSVSVLLAVIGREIGVWWINSSGQFPIEEISGIALFMVIPTTIHFVFGRPSTRKSVAEPFQESPAPETLSGTSTMNMPSSLSEKHLEMWAESLSVHLTPQELRICHCLLSGLSHPQIAERLYISPNTLKTHLRNIYRKTAVKNRFELVTLMTQGSRATRPHSVPQ